MSDINDQEKAAAAIFYDKIHAPWVSASGRGDIAEEIVRIAQSFDVPIYENKELAALLSTLDIGDEIPEALYITIAEVIAFAYQLKADKTQARAEANMGKFFES